MLSLKYLVIIITYCLIMFWTHCTQSYRSGTGQSPRVILVVGWPAGLLSVSNVLENILLMDKILKYPY